MNSEVDRFSESSVCGLGGGGGWIKKPNIHHMARNDIVGNHKPSYLS